MATRKDWTGINTRYRVEYDQFLETRVLECNGEPRPLTEDEYKDNEYQKNGATVPYAEYLKYQGNPERHVYYGIIREDRCPCCDTFVAGGSLWNIDVMDDNDENIGAGVYELKDLPGYFKDVAGELESDATERLKAAN